MDNSEQVKRKARVIKTPRYRVYIRLHGAARVLFEGTAKIIHDAINGTRAFIKSLDNGELYDFCVVDLLTDDKVRQGVVQSRRELYHIPFAPSFNCNPVLL